MTLSNRKLGGQGLEVSALGLGCMGMSQYYGPSDENESIATIHRAIELGCTFFDTAYSYGPFTNEELLGRAIEDRRDQVIIATKFGSRFEGKRIVGMDSRPDHVREAVEGCILRLRTDCIDLLYPHRVDCTVPIEDVTSAVGDLIAKAKSDSSAFPRWVLPPSGERMQSIRFLGCRVSIGFGNATWRRR